MFIFTYKKYSYVVPLAWLTPLNIFGRRRGKGETHFLTKLQNSGFDKRPNGVGSMDGTNQKTEPWSPKAKEL